MAKITTRRLNGNHPRIDRYKAIKWCVGCRLMGATESSDYCRECEIDMWDCLYDSDPRY